MSVATYPAQVDTRVNVNISRWLFRGYRLFAGETRYFVRGINRWALMGPVGPTVALAEGPPAPHGAPGSEPTAPVSPPPPPAPPPSAPVPPSPPAPSPAAAQSSPWAPGSPPPSPPPPPTYAEPSPTGPPPAPPTKRRGWTGGRVALVILGCVLGLIALGILAAAGAATWATSSQRDSAGFLSSDTHRFTTPTYAITSGGIDLGTGTHWLTPADIFGKVRIRATATNPTAGVFIGVGPQAAVDNYLAGVGHEVVTNWANGDTETRLEPGNGRGPQSAPGDAAIWTAQASGQGTQTLSWRPESGQWEVVVMNQDGAAGVSVLADAGATIPDLAWVAVILWVIGGLLLAGAVALVVVPVVHASRKP
jgi:hypothetical protein